MRIRSTKPEFWRSETIASLEWEVRLVLKGIESYVDDNGVGKDSVALICADVFPHDLASDSGTFARVSRALQKLAEANILARYTLNGERLIYVRKWKSIQRVDKPNDGRFPRPDGTLEYREDVDESVTCDSGVTRDSFGSARDCYANVPEVVAPVTEEQRSSGTEEKDLAAQKAPPKTPRGKRLPENWKPADTTKAWAEKNFSHLNLGVELEKFTNHWTAASGQSSRKLDWDATFRNWLHNARAPALKAVVNGSGHDAKVNDYLAYANPKTPELEQ